MQKKLMIEISSFANSILELTISAPQGNLIMKLGAEACDPLSELGKLLFDLHAVYEEPTRLGKDEPCYLFWDGDGGQYTWCLTPGHDKTISIQINFCPDVAAGIYTDSVLKLAAVASLDELSDDLFCEMKKILELHSFNGYRHHWRQKDFPLGLFLKLSRLGNNEASNPPSLKNDLLQLEKILN
jgi:hypothetical protein